MEAPPGENTPCESSLRPLSKCEKGNTQVIGSSSSAAVATHATPTSVITTGQSSHFPTSDMVHKRPRIVTGFGRERVDDVSAHEARISRDENQRAKQRYEGGLRGRMRDWDDNDLDRSEGGAWHAGKRI